MRAQVLPKGPYASVTTIKTVMELTIHAEPGFLPTARLPCNICRSPCRPLLRAALPATPVWLRLDSTLHQNRGSGTVQLELKLPVQERVSTRVPAPLGLTRVRPGGAVSSSDTVTTLSRCLLT